MHIDKHIKILDCPGIVMTSTSDDAVILRNCVKIEQLVDPVSAVETILRRCSKKQVGNINQWQDFYFWTFKFSDCNEILQMYTLKFM